MRRGTMSSVRREAFASSPAFVRHWRVDQRSQRPTTVAGGSLHVSCAAPLCTGLTRGAPLREKPAGPPHLVHRLTRPRALIDASRFQPCRLPPAPALRREPAEPTHPRAFAVAEVDCFLR